jgi:hypothetical protein
MLQVSGVLLQGKGGGKELLLSEFTRATPSQSMQLQGNPLLGMRLPALRRWKRREGVAGTWHWAARSKC